MPNDDRREAGSETYLGKPKMCNIVPRPEIIPAAHVSQIQREKLAELDKASDQYVKDVNKLIEEAAKAGKSSCETMSMGSPIKRIMMGRLIKAGYEVKETDTGNRLRVKWSENEIVT